MKAAQCLHPMNWMNVLSPTLVYMAASALRIFFDNQFKWTNLHSRNCFQHLTFNSLPSRQRSVNVAFQHVYLTRASRPPFITAFRSTILVTCVRRVVHKAMSDYLTKEYIHRLRWARFWATISDNGCIDLKLGAKSTEIPLVWFASSTRWDTCAVNLHTSVCLISVLQCSAQDTAKGKIAISQYPD